MLTNRFADEFGTVAIITKWGDTFELNLVTENMKVRKSYIFYREAWEDMQLYSIGYMRYIKREY